MVAAPAGPFRFPFDPAHCLLIEDATASYFAAFKAAAIEMIRAQGAIVGGTTPLARFAGALP
jgi:hypothetical protein